MARPHAKKGREMVKRTLLLLSLSSTLALAALPQKQQLDTEAEGFKGRVKSIFIEHSELKQSSGKSGESARRPAQKLSFDSNGNLTVDVQYDPGGELFDSRTYLFIDGQRVVKHEILTKHFLTLSDPRAEPRSRPYDPRYSWKIEYKFDSEGHRTEVAWLYSDGSSHLRYVDTLHGNRKERLVYSEDGSVNQKYSSTLDDKGNEVESVSYNVNDDSVDYKWNYTYLEFDSQGNWIKRLASLGKRENFKPKPVKITYRTITYY
jgi:hypothetical protein